jgi:hypothetical protein
MLDEIGIEGLTISNSEDMSTQLTEQFIMEHQGGLVSAHSMKLQALNNLMQIKS